MNSLNPIPNPGHIPPTSLFHVSRALLFALYTTLIFVGMFIASLIFSFAMTKELTLFILGILSMVAIFGPLTVTISDPVTLTLKPQNHSKTVWVQWSVFGRLRLKEIQNI